METARAGRMRLKSCNLLDLNAHGILIDILKRLPCESVCCIRCVCKALLKTVDDDTSLVALHTRFLTATNAVAQVPQLMSFSAPVTESGVIAEMQPVKFDCSAALKTRGEYAINVSTLYTYRHPTFMIDLVFCNLFCFSSAHDCFLVDPLRGDVLRLPKHEDTNHKGSFSFYGMGFDSITNTIKILYVKNMKALVLELGKNSWLEIPSTPPCHLPELYHFTSPKNACAYGDMHWLVRGKSGCRIMSFDFKKEEFCFTPHPPMLQSSLSNLHLLNMRGSLALVDTSLSNGTTTKIQIWLMNDYDKKQWTCDYSLNIDMFDFHKELGLFTKVTCGVWEHGIFFKNLDEVPAFFLDLRCDLHSMNFVRCTSGKRTKIVSYTGSLICLKNYQSLVDTEQGSRHSFKSYCDFLRGKSYCNLIEEAQGFTLFLGYRLRASKKVSETLQ